MFTPLEVAFKGLPYFEKSAKKNMSVRKFTTIGPEKVDGMRNDLEEDKATMPRVGRNASKSP